MSFQTGLSGLNAASRNLDVIGNNIANANTVGMKSSRGEFAELMASSLGAGGGGGGGIGVTMANTSQQFSQGNINITGNDLDVAINGNGFFQLTMPDQSAAYTRDGQFKLDKLGNIVTNSGANLMGYPTDTTGKATSATIQALQLPTNAPLAAKSTSAIKATLNLDARAVIATEATGVTAKYTTTPISSFNFATIPATPTASVASGAYTVATSGNSTDAFQFKVDGTKVSDRLVAGATAANLDIDVAAFVAASNGAYTQTGSIAGNNLILKKTDGTAMTTATSFSAAVASTGAATGSPSGGTFAGTGFIGTTTAGGPADTSANRTITVAGPGGTSTTLVMNTNTTNINGLVTALNTGTNATALAAAGVSVAAGANGNLVFTASNANKAGAVTVSGTAVPSGGTSVKGLAATALVPTPRTTYGTSMTAYDSQGVGVPVSLYFVKVATPGTAGATVTDTWEVYDSTSSSASPLFNMEFNANGAIVSPTTAQTITLTSTKAALGTFQATLDVTKAAQSGTAFSVSTLTQDGYAPGELLSLKIGENGIITASYSNGQTQSAGQVALADFRNVQGLAPSGGNTWVETFASGQPVQGGPGVGKFGALSAGAVEESNVDLTAELVNMMTAQRAYQANAQTIKTQDQIMTTLVNLR